MAVLCNWDGNYNYGIVWLDKLTLGKSSEKTSRIDPLATPKIKHQSEKEWPTKVTERERKLVRWNENQERVFYKKPREIKKSV